MKTTVMGTLAGVALAVAAFGCSAEPAEEQEASGASAIMVQDLRIAYERGTLQSEVDQTTQARFDAFLEVGDSSLSVDDNGNITRGSIHVIVNGSARGVDDLSGNGYRAPYRLGAATAILARCGAGPWHLVEYTDQKASWGKSELKAEWKSVFGGIAPANVNCNPGDDIELGLGVWYASYTYAPAAPNGERPVLQRWRCFPRAACSAVSATSE